MSRSDICPVCLSPAGYPCRTREAMGGGYIRNLAYGLVAPFDHSQRLATAPGPGGEKP